MERKIDKNFIFLDEAINYLLEAKANGEHVYIVYDGHELHSDNITIDSAYKEVEGCTKAEWDKKREEWRLIKERKEREIKAREQRCAEKVQASRTGEKKPITLKEVVNGLKYFAEHWSIDQEEFVDGLLELGCNFSLEDINQQFPNETEIFEGLKQGDIKSGATVIVNVRDSGMGRAYCIDRFLSVDDEASIYQFIRVTTGDETYTKEMVDALNNSNSIHR